MSLLHLYPVSGKVRTTPLTVDFNGTEIRVHLGDTPESTEFFVPQDAIVQPGLVRNQEMINVKAEFGTTIASVHLITFAETEL